MLGWAALALGMGPGVVLVGTDGVEGRVQLCDCKRMGWRKSNASCSEWEPFRAGRMLRWLSVKFCAILLCHLFETLIVKIYPSF